MFKNLSQIEFGSIYYDFHNEFDCFKIIFDNNKLSLYFKKINENYIVSLSFESVKLFLIEFINFSEFQNLTIDNLYRGRFEKNGKILEFEDDQKSYFYLEFDNGAKMEFWSDEILIEKIEN